MDIFIILGMHRSGTSALARCLREMGVSFDLPRIQDGFWEKHIEYYQVNQLNDQILTSWKKPVLNRNWLTTRWMDYKVKTFVNDVIPDDHLVGIKDPRMLLTFDYWSKHLDNFRIMGIIRRPEEVASSLSIRDEYGKADFMQGLDLWKAHNEKLLEYQQQYKFPILDFNTDKPTLGKQLELACKHLDLPFSYDVFDSIFTDKKKHHHSENIPEEHQAVYQSLVDITRQPLA